MTNRTVAAGNRPAQGRRAGQVVGYARLSPRPDGTYDLGMARQRKEIARVAKLRGLTVAKVYEDVDRSAYSGLREQYDAMLAAVRRGEVAAIVCYDVDRLYRQPKELEVLIELANAGLGIFHAQGALDLSTSDGRAMARILVTMAMKSSDDESRRMKLKHAQLAEAGMPAGGPRPFGYEADHITVNPAEKALIREAVDHLLGGGSARGLLREWHARGIKTANGKDWSHPGLRAVLAGHRIVGLRARNGAVVGPAVWEAIVTPEEHARLRAILSGKRQAPGTNARSYLLTGFAVCGHADCGELLVARRSKGKRALGCSSAPGRRGCNRLKVTAEYLDDYVVREMLAVLDTTALARARQGVRKAGAGDSTDLVVAIARDEAKLDALAADYADDVLTRDQFRSASDKVRARVEEARRQLAAEAPEKAALRALEGLTRSEWDKLPLDRQRAILRLLVASVTVLPAPGAGGRWNEERVVIAWRD